jgi:anthranilate phosphoribosyltransferase
LSTHTWPDVLGSLVAGTDLSAEQTAWAMGEILSGEATPAQIAGFAVALRAKGETIDELTGLVEAMYAVSTPITVPGRLLDVVGTGGDRSMSVNISTMAAIVAAGAGARVVKHGNRSASSKAGSADVLEALGIRLDLPADRVAEVAVEAGITFCFAAGFHPALRHAAVPRRELGVGTTFNFLGPLANPARVTRQVVGVSDPGMADRVIGTLQALGAKHAMVFFGHDGLDELTTTDVSTLRELRDGDVTRTVLDPLDLGIARAEPAALRGGTPTDNAAIARRVLEGEKGAVRDVVLLNAAAALVVADAAPTLAAGIEVASSSIDQGRAAAVLETFVATSRAARAAEAG